MKDYKKYIKFLFSNAETDDFISIANNITGKDYIKFFNQWLKSSDHPVYQNYYVITEEDQKFRIDLTINQIQDNETAYEMPLKFEVSFSDGTKRLMCLLNSKRAENYFFTFEKEPIELVFDPFNNIILKESETIQINAIDNN